jgi:hypothetical protein
MCQFILLMLLLVILIGPAEAHVRSATQMTKSDDSSSPRLRRGRANDEVMMNIVAASVSDAFRNRRAQFFEKRRALRGEALLEFLRAIALATGPWFCSVLVPTRAARVRILDAEQLKILFPIRAFLGEWRITKARLEPRRHALAVHPRPLHVAQVFVACDGAFPKRATVDRAKQTTFSARLYAAFHEVTHKKESIMIMRIGLMIR